MSKFFVTESPFMRTGMRATVALAIGVLGTLTAQTQSTHAATVHATQVNCNGYVAGMQVLAQDVQGIVYRAPTLSHPSAKAQIQGVVHELQTVLHANGKPVDNFKVVRDMRGAMVSTYLAVDARVSQRNITKANTLLGNSRADLADAQILLREICLPSKIRQLPCTGSCIESMVGSGRVTAREHPWITFVVPTNYTVRYAWNCQAASAEGKNILIGFQGYENAVRFKDVDNIPLGIRIVDGAGVQHAGKVVRDDTVPIRVVLLVHVEQACQWQLTVVKG